MNDQIQSFKVPWALDSEGNLIAAANGVPKTPYSCPGCLRPIIFRSGVIKVRHFAHKAGFGCSWESYLHKTAKFQIKKTMEDWLENRGSPPIITGGCDGTDWWSCDGEIRRPLIQGKVDEVRLECQIKELRPDVVLLLARKPVLAIEILVTHEVDESKRSKSDHLWLELSAVDVLDYPLRWRPVQHNIPGFTKCNMCRSVNIDSLDLKISRHVANFENWVAKARNQNAAMRSHWWIDKIEEELRIVKDEAIVSWEKTNSGTPPEWESEYVLDDYCESIYRRIENKYEHNQGNCTNLSLPIKPDDDIPF